MEFTELKAEMHQMAAHLADKGKTLIRFSLSYYFPDGIFGVSIHHSDENGKSQDGIHKGLASEEDLGLLWERVRAVPSEKELKTKAMLEAIALLRNGASELGIELPEGWVNPLEQLSDKLRLNILEHHDADGA